MGFETFRIELRGRKANYGEADAIVRQLPHIKLDPQSVPMRGSNFYLLDDGRHVQMPLKGKTGVYQLLEVTGLAAPAGPAPAATSTHVSG